MKRLLTSLWLAALLGCAQTSSHSVPAAKGADSVLRELRAGNERFAAGVTEHPRQNAARRSELSSGQSPHTVVLSCSDSRVPPEIVFDSGLGDLFVVRAIGEVADDAALASVEYGVEHLHAKVVLVMGHRSCGAVKAALDIPDGSSAGSPSLDRVLGMIRPNLAGPNGAGTPERLAPSVSAQARAVARDLVERSAIVRHAVESGATRVVPAVYDLESGQVEFLD